MKMFLAALLAAGILGVLASSVSTTHGDEPVPSFTLPALDEFWAILERPLFPRSRRPNDDTPTAETAATDGEDEDQAAPGMVLVGTATDQDTRAVAVIRNSADATEFRVWVGDTVGGWHVKAIHHQAIVLVSAGTEVTVTLDKPILPEIPAHP